MREAATGARSARDHRALCRVVTKDKEAWPMSADENKDLVRRGIEEGWNRGNIVSSRSTPGGVPEQAQSREEKGLSGPGIHHRLF